MKNPMKQFWDWFAQNNKAYLFLEEVPDDLRETMLDNLQAELHKYCDQLYFEIGGHAKDDQELIITAMGNSQYFEKLDALIKEAPVIKDWKFIAYVAPTADAFKINFEDAEFQSSEMWFLPLDDEGTEGKLSLAVFVRNFELVKESKWLMSGIYQALYSVLGEKSFALNLKHIEVGQLPDDPIDEGMMELSELPWYIKWRMKNVRS
jgi:hypothetical protein